MEIERKTLNEIVRRRAPRLLVVSAPAGYGKSTLVRQMLAHVGDWAVCDCLSVRDEVDLSRAVLAAFAESRPLLANAIAQAQLGISSDARDWKAVVSQFWSGEGPEVFVFENAEALTRCPSACSLFQQLLRLKDRTTVVCSRDSVSVPYGHGFDPTNVLKFGVDNLRFSSEEIREALPSLNDDEQAEVERISRGWPIVVALLGRAVKETSVGEVVASLPNFVDGQLLDYLARELLNGLNRDESELALILAVLPDCRFDDLYRAWPSITLEDIERLSLRLPLSRSGEAMRVHPMLAQLLRERCGPRAVHIVRQAAEAAQAAGDDTRAAELYLSIGDEFAAASTLRDVGTFLMSTPTPRFAAVISQFAEKTLVKFPALWSNALMHRGYSIPPYDWLRSAEAIWNDLPVDVEPEIRASIFSSLMNAHTNIGLCSRASDLLDEYRSTLSEVGGQAVATLWSAALDSFDGRYDRIPEYTRLLTPLFDTSQLLHALYLYDVVSAIPRTRGEWQRDAETLQRARELFSCTSLSVALLGLVESAFAHWFAGDDEQCDAFVAELERRITIANERGHRFFIACARGVAKTVPYGYEKAKARAQGLLIASARAVTVDDARHFASAGVQVADQSERRYLRILARCAHAVLDNERREELLTEALSLSEGLDSVPMREAVTCLLHSRVNQGILTPFVMRYEAFCRTSCSTKVRVLRGEVLVNDKSLCLGRSEFALLLALAQAPRSHSISELGDLLFPDLDADSASNRIYVYIHRVRQRLGKEVVIADDKGYRIGPAVDVDLWQLRSVVAKKIHGTLISSHEINRFASYEVMSGPELDSLALRLRLPEQIVSGMREAVRQLAVLRKDLGESESRIALGEV